ncbi:hypothetical protein EDD11_003001 [Mortierella claussenii]|nr:hypothetical protein EDD11_003001 [Mortierella claussenii]
MAIRATVEQERSEDVNLYEMDAVMDLEVTITQLHSENSVATSSFLYDPVDVMHGVFAVVVVLDLHKQLVSAYTTKDLAGVRSWVVQGGQEIDQRIAMNDTRKVEAKWMFATSGVNGRKCPIIPVEETGYNR